MLRLCACLGIEAHIIEPAGFPTSDRAFRRAGMDYLDAVTIVRHGSWRDFEAWRRGRTPPPGAVHDRRGDCPISITAIRADDVLLFGRESAGVPEEVHASRRRAPRHPDAARPALAQCRGRRRHGGRRSAAADRRRICWPESAIARSHGDRRDGDGRSPAQIAMPGFPRMDHGKSTANDSAWFETLRDRSSRRSRRSRMPCPRGAARRPAGRPLRAHALEPHRS